MVRNLPLILMATFLAGSECSLTDPASERNSTRSELENPFDTYLHFGDTAWMMVASILVMLLTPAIGFFYSGLVKTKNMLSMLGQTLTIYAIVSILWTLIGYSLVFSETSNAGLIGGLDHAALRGIDFSAAKPYSNTIPKLLFFFFQMQYACFAPALIIGGCAERVRFKPLMLFSLIWHLIVYCPLAHWNWNHHGWLHELHVTDFSGGNAVDVSSGISAFAIIVFLEFDPIRRVPKRKVKQLEDHYKVVKKEHVEEAMINVNFGKHSLVFLVLGTSLIWFGWFGFNGGFALGITQKGIMAIINTSVGPSVTLLTWIVFDLFYKGRPTVSGMCTAILSGLVGISASAGIIRIWGAAIVGFLTAILPYLFIHYRETYKLFDDRLDVFAVHGFGGAIGGLLTGIFYCDLNFDDTCSVKNGAGAIYGSAIQIAYQFIGVFAVVGYSFSITYFLIWILSTFMEIGINDHLEDSIDKLDYEEYALPDTEFNFNNLAKALDKDKMKRTFSRAYSIGSRPQ